MFLEKLYKTSSKPIKSNKKNVAAGSIVKNICILVSLNFNSGNLEMFECNKVNMTSVNKNMHSF